MAPRLAQLPAVSAVLVLGAALGIPGAAVGETAGAPVPPRAGATVVGGWRWPVAEFRLVLPYEAPAHAYGPGHRGVDLRPVGDDVLLAPAAGVIAFSGTVVDRGVVTIDHGDGLVTTLEPVRDAAAVGTVVAAGDVVARLGSGGHAPTGTVHFGVRRDGEYINPVTLLDTVPRAVLLPCC